MDTILQYENLVRSIISKYTYYGDYEDLYQVGMMGLVKACKNYKESTAKFSTYAYTYIYGEIYTYINNQRGIKLARENYSLYKKITEAQNVLRQKLMKEPSTYELSSFLELDYRLVENIIASMQNIDSLERAITNNDKDVLLSDMVRDNKDYYNEEINSLPEPWKEVIKLRYYEDKTQNEVAQILGMNQVEISRGESKVLKKIRNNYQNVI